MLVRNVPNISPGSVATRLRCGGIFVVDFYTVTAKFGGGRNFKIYRHLANVTGKNMIMMTPFLTRGDH